MTRRSPFAAGHIVTLLVAIAALPGCQYVETKIAMQEGTMAIEPHPDGSDAQRVMFLVWPDGGTLLFTDWNRADVREDSVRTMLGPDCPAPRLTHERDVPFGRDIFGKRRARAYYRLEC